MIQALERSFMAVHESDDDFAVLRLLGALYQDVIAAQDVVINHGLASHLQREGIALAREVGELQRVLSFDGFYRDGGGDAASQWNIGGSSRCAAFAPLLYLLR